MVREILVVKRDVLFKNNEFTGFLPIEKTDFSKIILGNYSYEERNDNLENNPEFQQIIPYVWIINPETREIFVYRRSEKGYHESRLRNKWSCGLGGHVDKEDSGNPIETAMMRELQEEVRISDYPTPKIIGYINDDEDSVGKVHFGVVAIAETTLSIEKGDDEMAECKMVSVGELEKLFADPNNDIESWTKISWPYVKNYLESH